MCALPLKTTPTFFNYTEADTTRGTYNGNLTERAGWKVPAALSNPINPGNVVTGYRLYIGANLLNYSRTLVVSGSPFTGDKTIPYTHTLTGWDGGGWNLLANPYPSEVDWAAAAFDGANASAPKAITTWNSASSNYASYTATSATGGLAVNGGQRYVASSQGFFLKSLSGGTLTFKESHKNAANPNTFFRSAGDNTLTVRFTQGANTDEAAVAFLPIGLLGRDQFDADNMASPTVDVSTHPVAGLNLAINVMPELTARYEVPVSFVVPATGTVTLSFDGIESFPVDARIYLRDAYLSTTTELSATSTVIVNVTSDAATQGTGRFTLIFAPNSVTAVKEAAMPTQLHVWPNPSKASSRLNVSLTRMAGQQVTLTLTDLAGKAVLTTSTILDAEATATIETGALPAGIYTLKATAAGQAAQQRVVVQ